MAIGLSLAELRKLFADTHEKGLANLGGQLQAATHGENPAFKKELDSISLSPAISTYISGLYDSYTFDAMLEVIDANNKAIEKDIASMFSRKA